jgi:hypothetical protein
MDGRAEELAVYPTAGRLAATGTQHAFMFPNLHRFLTFVYILVLSTEDIESGFVRFSCHEKFPPSGKNNQNQA